MKAFLKFCIAIVPLLLLSVPAQAQTAAVAKIVTTCNTQTYPVGSAQAITQTAGGVQCTAGSASGAPTNVVGLVGGYEFNASAIPTVQTGSYSAGQSLGGLQTISIGATNSITGILTQIQIASKGGSVVASVIYVWQKNPTGTTCTDKTNFVASQTDNQQLIVQPQLLTPAVVVSAQDTTTYAAATNLIAPFVNGSTNTSLYACVVANATVTPGTTTDLRLNLQGAKDQP